jgi:hypothetical protein
MPGPVEIDAASEIGVRNSQPEGIGRVAVVGNLICWNNLGRNLVFADRSFRPRSVLGTTLFPGEDEPSQYDLDIHAVLDVHGLDVVLVLNHLGVVRGLGRSDLSGPGPVRHVEPRVVTSFAADVERTIVAGRSLVASRPRVERAGGVLISPPLDRVALDKPISAELVAEAFGEVTALEVISGSAEPLIALGGDGRVALAPLEDVGLGRPIWECRVGFRVAVLMWDGRVLWAGGPERAAGDVDDYDWEGLHAGAFALLDGHDGEALASGPLPADVAWGTGGVALVRLGPFLAAVGRSGSIHMVDPGEPTAWRSAAALSTSSLGIAHAAAAGDRVVYGFNRGGYRLHSVGQPDTEGVEPGT